jgi:hypothetical protein
MTISGKVGCPARFTMDTVEIGYGDKQENMRCIAVWCSHLGPVIFDATNLSPIWGDVKVYFDVNDSRCVNMAALKNAVGWVDPNFMEYNLCIPSGTGQTTNNIWLFYDMINRKWWRKKAPQTPQAVTRVTDTDGTQYMMGFFDDGIMRRLEWGKQFDNVDIERYVVTGDILPTGDMWEVNRMRALKTLVGIASETAWLSVVHTGSGVSISSGTHIGSFNMNAGTTFVKDTQDMNLAAWSHKLKFTLTGNVTDKGLKLIAWGAEFTRERQDR